MASTIPWERVRRAGNKLTTPLHPDDYLSLVNPLWSTRELRGRVEKVVPETEDAATLVIRPGWGWRYDHRPGQYVGIGVQVDGKFQWRSYSVSSPPKRSGRTISITVRAMPEGLLSAHLVKGLEPGTIVRLALPEGDFVLPDPPPAKVLFLVGGSGITPVMSMLRTLDRRGTMPDVVMHYSSTTPERMIFRDEIEALAEKHPSLTFHQLHTDIDGMLDLGDLDDDLASQLGRISNRLVRIMENLPEIGRVHVDRWGDGGSHLHIWFFARTARLTNVLGSTALEWDDILPPGPEDVWRADLHTVATKLANWGGDARA